MTALACLGLVVAPAVAAVIGLPAGRRHRAAAAAIAILGATISLLCSGLLVLHTWSGKATASIDLLGPLDLGRPLTEVQPVELLAFSLTAPTALVCLAVTLVVLAVQVYSAGYLVPHAGDTGPLRYPAFAATVSLFSVSMLVVVGADDLLLLLVGWEVMGFCSYLLIGHHSERPTAKRAALQAGLVTRTSDIGFVIGVLALAAAGGTTNIPRLLATADTLSLPALTLALTGLVIGVAGKSAQFPFHGWLPDAMEGPTPVSALLHAATMVAAGVVVLARLGPLLDRSTPALTLLAVLACLSMLGAGLAAFCADDLKRALAWSTVSQVAVMLAAIAVGSPAGRAGALMLMLAHAAFKALLFLGSGMVAVRFGGTGLAGVADLWRRDRGLAVLLGIGLAGLAAVPPLAGFVGKEGVLTAAEHAARGGAALASPTAVGVLVCLAITSVLTGLYSGRLFGALARADRPVPVVADRPTRVAVERAPASRTATGPHPALGDERDQPKPHPGPAFQRAPRPEEAAVDESLTFVDQRGHRQDWDLIAHLDTSEPRRWSRDARAQRAFEAEQARRRLDAGHADPHTMRIARSAPPRVRYESTEEPPNRLARAVRGQRLEPARDSSWLDATDTAPTPPTSSPPTSTPPTSTPPTPNRRPDRIQVDDPALPPPEPVPGPRVPASMSVPVWLLAVPTLGLGLLPLVSPAGLRGFEIGLISAVLGALLAVAGVALGLLRGPDGQRDVATRVPEPVRAAAAGGFGYQRLQSVLVIRPTLALAKFVTAGDDAVLGTWMQAPGLFPVVGRLLARVRTRQVSDYLGWLAAAVVVVATVAALVGGV